MKLELDNRTKERVQFRIQQGPYLFGVTYLEPSSRASTLVLDEYAVHLEYEHDGWEHEMEVRPSAGGAQYVVSQQSDRNGSPVSIDQVPPRRIKSLGCENTTIAPVVFRVERRQPHLVATLAVGQWQNQQIDIGDNYEIRAVVAGRMSAPLYVDSLDRGIAVTHDAGSQEVVLRQ